MPTRANNGEGWAGDRVQPRISLVGTLLLDSLSATSVAAYSTRKLRSAYAGKCMNVYNGSSSTDIGFVSNTLDTATLIAFGANCYVNKMYDQSGNSNDFTNNMTGTTSAPQIVTSSALTLTINGHPAFGFTFAKANYFNTSFTQANPDSWALIGQYTLALASTHFLDSESASGRQLIGSDSSTVWQLFGGTSVLSGGTFDTNLHGFIGIFNDPNSALYVDNTLTAGPSSTGTNSAINDHPGAGNTAATLTGRVPEIICFTSALGSSDRTAIHSSWQTWWGTP